MSIPLFHRREHLLQLGTSAAALALPVSTLLALSDRECTGEKAIRTLFAQLSTGRMFGPGRNNAWAIIEADEDENLFVQALVPPTRQCIWLEAVSAKYVANWNQRMTPKKLAVLAALGFNEPSPRSPNYWQEIPRADTRSTDLAARIAALTLHEVYGVMNLVKAQAMLFLPGKLPLESSLGSVRAWDSPSRVIPTGVLDGATPTSVSSGHPQHPGIKDAPSESYGGGFVIGGFPSARSSK